MHQLRRDALLALVGCAEDRIFGRSVPGRVAPATAVDLIGRLRQLSAEGVSGRLDVIGSVGGRIYLDGGLVGCAERHGAQTMLLAMADAGLFSPSEWASALRTAPTERWRALVGGDQERMDGLVEFARGFTSTELNAILGCPARSAAFARGAAHSLGTLAAWRLDALVEAATPPPSIDRAEFLELLSEISPHVD